MNIPEINQKSFDDIFRRVSKVGFVFPKGSKVKGSSFDPNRNVGYEKSFTNALPFKYISKIITPNSLLWKEIGLSESGAIQIIIKDSDADLIKVSRKVNIDNIDFYAFSKSVSNRVQIYSSQFSGYSKIILFRDNS